MRGLCDLELLLDVRHAFNQHHFERCVGSMILFAQREEQAHAFLSQPCQRKDFESTWRTGGSSFNFGSGHKKFCGWLRDVRNVHISREELSKKEESEDVQGDYFAAQSEILKLICAGSPGVMDSKPLASPNLTGPILHPTPPFSGFIFLHFAAEL